MELKIVSQSSSVPSMEELDAVVPPSGGGLPGSFKLFATELGYGRLCGLLIVYSASLDHPDSLINQGARVQEFISQALEEGYLEFDPDGSEDIARQLYPFAGSENGEYLAWDMGSLRNEEYDIYVVAARMAGITFAARSLDELITKLTSAAVKDVLGSGYEPLSSTFEGL